MNQYERQALIKLIADTLEASDNNNLAATAAQVLDVEVEYLGDGDFLVGEAY